MFVRDKDLDALREGIREQVRRELIAEDSKRITDRIFRREYIRKPHDPELVQAVQLKVGDKLLATDSGYSFYIKGTITKIDHPDAENLWIEAADDRGGWGNLIGKWDTVLRKFRYQR